VAHPVKKKASCLLQTLTKVFCKAQLKLNKDLKVQVSDTTMLSKEQKLVPKRK